MIIILSPKMMQAIPAAGKLECPCSALINLVVVMLKKPEPAEMGEYVFVQEGFVPVLLERVATTSATCIKENFTRVVLFETEFPARFPEYNSTW